MGAAGTILAIDPSGRGTGIAEGVPGSTPRLQTLRFATDELDGPVEIFGHAAAWFSQYLESHTLSVLAIEIPLMVHNPMIVAGLYAIFTGMARARGVRVMPVTIAEWRRYFLGRGRLDGATAKREAVRICRSLKWEAEDHNAAEAAGVWLWCCAQLSPSVAHRIEPLFTGAQSS
jgi:hypothetical protein